MTQTSIGDCVSFKYILIPIFNARDYGVRY